jgi:hypothetical protein
MPTTDIEAPTKHAGWFGRTWHKIATVLAAIGLVDVTGQLIKWASIIHWIAERYAVVRGWVFSWLPLRLPPEWHDPTVLFLILFSVTNVGLYRRTGHTLAFYVVEKWRWFAIATVLIFPVLEVYIVRDALSGPISLPITPGVVVIFTLPYVVVGALAAGLITLIFAAAVIAWRWVLTTATIFGALVAINYAYVLWLAPLAEH